MIKFRTGNPYASKADVMLASPPAAGAGIHRWLFACAAALHADGAGTQHIERKLSAASQGVGRKVPDSEITQAAQNAGRGSVTAIPRVSSHAGALGKPSGTGLPKHDRAATEAALLEARRDGVDGVDALGWYSDNIPRGEWLGRLFPDAKYLCLAPSHPGGAATKPAADWAGIGDDYELLVPSPMIALTGITQAGKPSVRSLSNTGPRRWLVIEFDSGTPDQQAALHWHLGSLGILPLKLVLSSGGKSMHGWYGPVPSETLAHRLMSVATRIGGDPATWTRCQLVRLPGGTRNKGTSKETKQQPIFWKE
ncbi:hypothetical protein UFOVP296_15 [uncultured Caudovirales phage]|uniref:Uncharacterized protein n=1 Tax=uncultured Caudovirales phage TaxID=2100421 RepID=A0A6J5RY08_9CAUD|nr:hypothetical protein UFOVP296_15 [uncultured Caudovirales phage]CAB4170069.1 hypothetical protein UFOVP912_34 [uncultured Caudovirales phage]CAB4199207.1 hypothetical protein UFOVP1334_22 [uncultured Caudovirales phage]